MFRSGQPGKFISAPPPQIPSPLKDEPMPTKDKQTIQDRSDNLRRKAEERLKSQAARIKELSPEEVQTLVHDLQVYQMELEMQNEEIRRTQAELETTLTKYTDLYDFAPVAYLTLDDRGWILEANLNAARLLMMERFRLVQQPFAAFLLPAERNKFRTYLVEVVKGQPASSLELELPRGGGTKVAVQLNSLLIPDAAGNPQVRISLIDITERKQMEEATRQSEEKYRVLVNQIPAIVFKGYPDWSVDFYDRKVEDLTGYNKEDFESRKIKWCDLILPDDLAKARCKFIEALKTNKSYVREYRISRKDGEILWTHVRGQIFCDSEGKIEYISGVAFDISERKQMENALSEEAVRRRVLFEQSKDGIVILDQEGKVYEANQQFADMLGYSLGEVQQLYVWDWDAQWTREQLLEMFPRVGAVGQRFETVHRRQDGTVYGVEITANWVTLAGQQLGFCICRDISQRKAADKALRESEERYRRIVETAREGIWVIDSEYHTTYVNQVMADMLGCTPTEMIGRQPTAFMFAEDTAQFQERMVRRQQGQNDIYEYRFRRQDGGELWTMLSANPILDEEGHFQGSFAMISDITDRKRVEEAKKKMEAQLQQAQKLEALGTLAGGISHEFNNILWGIMGSAELGMMNLGAKPEPAKLSANLKTILQLSDRARQLIIQIMAFSRKSAVDIRPVRPHHIVEEAAKLLRGSIPKNIDIVCETDRSRGSILADPVQIQQIVMNLGINAYHAMEQEGGVLRIKLEEVIADSEIASQHPGLKAGNYLRLTVADSGTGMDQETLKRMFDPFFTTKMVGKGTGLGLAVVHGIVESLGGGIIVQSEPGQGTTFIIYFPLYVSPEDEETRPDLEPLRGQGCILLVDDEAQLAEIAANLLRKLGYEVIVSTDGMEALKVFNEEGKRFDLLITDQSMPQMTGLELVRAIKGIRPEMPVILCSGYTKLEDDKKLQEAEISKVLTKPLRLRELSEAVKELLATSGN